MIPFSYEIRSRLVPAVAGEDAVAARVRPGVVARHCAHGVRGRERVGREQHLVCAAGCCHIVNALKPFDLWSNLPRASPEDLQTGQTSFGRQKTAVCALECRCRVRGLGCRVQSLGQLCRVQGAGCRVQVAGFRLQGAWGCSRRLQGAGCVAAPPRLCPR